MTAPKRTASRITVGWSARTGEWKVDSPAGRVLRSLAIGCYLVDAAAIGGVARSTVQNWLARGAEHRGEEDGTDRKALDVSVRPYVDFARAVELAGARIKLQATAGWVEAGKEDWRAYRDFLTHRFPELYRKPTERIEAAVNFENSPEWWSLRSTLMETSDHLCPDCRGMLLAAVNSANSATSGEQAEEVNP